MSSFLQRFGSLVTGVLQGFDRLVFRGTLRSIVHGPRLMAYLSRREILMKDFSDWAQERTDKIKAAAERSAVAIGQKEVTYLNSSSVSKEDLARDIARARKVETGLITVLSAVEPCMSYNVHCDRAAKRIKIESVQRRCLHLYYYLMHPQFGFMHVRVQTWAPFTVRVCLNGREWLARQMDMAKIRYDRRDNCFFSISDLPAAQALMDLQPKLDWQQQLQAFGREYNPIYRPDFENLGLNYYWSTYQSEWASDLMFRSPDELAKLYPQLIHHAISHFSSKDVLRFLGRKLGPTDRIPTTFKGEVTTDLKYRPEGVRIKHRAKANSIKMYDKFGAVLRVETTINEPSDFKVFRPKAGNVDAPPEWQEMRRTVEDLPRRAEVSQKSNERYLDALAVVEDRTALKEVAEPLCSPTRWKKQRVRALNPLAAEDSALLRSVAQGEFVINGLRNRDLCALLYAKPTDDPKEKRRRSAAVTRQLRMLRAHGILHKVPHTHRYQVSPKGRLAISAILAAHDASTQTLTGLALTGLAA
jgi:hypothetical protein